MFYIPWDRRDCLCLETPANLFINTHLFRINIRTDVTFLNMTFLEEKNSTRAHYSLGINATVRRNEYG